MFSFRGETKKSMSCVALGSRAAIAIEPMRTNSTPSAASAARTSRASSIVIPSLGEGYGPVRREARGDERDPQLPETPEVVHRDQISAFASAARSG